MKKLWILLAWAAIAAACSNEAELPSPQPSEDEMVEVSFNLAGDYVSVEETPLTRAFAENAKTIYALRVFTDTIYQGDKATPTYRETKTHAYGLFSDMKNARLSMKKGTHYKRFYVEALVIQEREDTVFNKEGHYGRPFGSAYLGESGYMKAPVITDFFIMSDEFDGSLDESAIATSAHSLESFARVDRYYGCTSFTVSHEGGINISMDRYAFSFTYNITPPIDGKIQIELPNKGVIYEVEAGNNQKEEQVIHNVPFKSANKDSSYDLKMIVRWERGSAELKNYTEEKVISVKRKKNYIINVNMNSRDNETNFGIDMDKSQFADEVLNIN